MDSLTLFNLIEQYIAKTNYKVEEVEKLKESYSPINGDMALIKQMSKLLKIVEECRNNLEELAEEIEEENKSDIFFIGHHEGNLRQKLRE